MTEPGRKMTREEYDWRAEVALWSARARRRGKLLDLCAAFLRSLNVESDRLEQRGFGRGEKAEVQYTFSRKMAESIEKETKDDCKWDSSRNIANREARREAKERRDQQRRDDSGEAAPKRRGRPPKAGGGTADAGADPDGDWSNRGVHTDECACGLD